MGWESDSTKIYSYRRDGDKMNLDEYLKLEEEEKQRYDFSAENATEEYERATSIEKYIIYKIYTSKSVWSDSKQFRKDIKDHYSEKKGGKPIKWIKDPDDFKNNPNSLLEQIYKKIWPELELYSDTMTSVQYIMSGYFESEIETGGEKSARLKISMRQQCSIQYMINLWATEEGKIEKKIKNAAKRMNEKEEGLDIFLSAWHTLGNYCPVPSGFNCPRSNFGKHDFWDLTLMMIRKWYLTDDEMLKERILKEDLYHYRSQEDDIEACVRWLNLCGGDEGTGEVRWEKFVQTLCFEDWVNCDKESSDYEYYEVIPLWEGHGWDNALLPVDNWRKFFLEYNRRILERAKKLIEKLSMIVKR